MAAGGVGGGGERAEHGGGFSGHEDTRCGTAVTASRHDLCVQTRGVHGAAAEPSGKPRTTRTGGRGLSSVTQMSRQVGGQGAARRGRGGHVGAGKRGEPPYLLLGRAARPKRL